jgi:uncharacterized protein involved in exopolysaccharide biosynthesis
MNKQSSSQADTSLESLNLLVFLFKWRVFLIVIVALAAIASIIASFVIEEKFKSVVTMFAAPQHSIGEQFYEETKRNDLLEYGEKEDAERILQILNSDRIRSRIIEKYNLWDHYEIPRETPGAYTLMQKEYNGNVSASLTKFGSIEIEVLDKNNELARDIANDIAFLADSVSNRMRNERAQDAFTYAESSLRQVQDEIAAMEDSLNVIYQAGVYDFDTQIEGLNEQYATAMMEGRSKQAEELRQQMARISGYANRFNKLSNLLEAAYDREAILKKRFDLMKIDATSKLPSTFVVDYAAAADKKAYPVRWLIVVMSVLSAFVFAVIAILIFENFKNLKSAGRI